MLVPSKRLLGHATRSNIVSEIDCDMLGWKLTLTLRVIYSKHTKHH